MMEKFWEEPFSYRIITKNVFKLKVSLAYFCTTKKLISFKTVNEK